MKIYIYALVDPRYAISDGDYYENEVRYVGQSKNPIGRYKSHIKESKRSGHTRKCCWIRKLLRLGLKPEFRLLQECNENTWADAEIYWIAYYKELGHELTNNTSGGDGVHDLSERSRKKMSKAQKKRFENPQERMKYSEMHKGKKESEETRAKLREAAKHRVYTDETRYKIHLSALGNKYPLGCTRSDETKQKLRKQKIGLKNPRSKFSRDDILLIRELATPIKYGKKGNPSKRIMKLGDIAIMFNVHPNTIGDVVNGYKYADVV